MHMTLSRKGLFQPLITREFSRDAHISQDLHEELKAYKALEVSRIAIPTRLSHYTNLIRPANVFCF